MSSATVQRPYKSRSEALGWLFGNPMDSFDSLIPVTPPSSMDYSFCPTKQNVVQYWMNCMDKTRNSYHSPAKTEIIWEVVNNLTAFWSNNTTGIELRYLCDSH